MEPKGDVFDVSPSELLDPYEGAGQGDQDLLRTKPVGGSGRDGVDDDGGGGNGDGDLAIIPTGDEPSASASEYHLPPDDHSTWH